jgi:hypothetical protein
LIFENLEQIAADEYQGGDEKANDELGPTLLLKYKKNE